MYNKPIYHEETHLFSDDENMESSSSIVDTSTKKELEIPEPILNLNTSKLEQMSVEDLKQQMETMVKYLKMLENKNTPTSENHTPSNEHTEDDIIEEVIKLNNRNML